MKRLIKRYVLQAQIDKESDEVNEGELNTGTSQPLSMSQDLGPEAELRESWRDGRGKGELQQEDKTGSHQPSVLLHTGEIGYFSAVGGRCHLLDK